MIKIFATFSLYMLAQLALYSQRGLISDMQAQEDKLRADTKQINQFFRRFNGEEDQNGKRYYETDKNYHSHKLREAYLPHLFDLSGGISDDQIAQFVNDMADKKEPYFLDFYQQEWVAEVRTIFKFRGQEKELLLFLHLQKQKQGYEWVIEDVMFDSFVNLFDKDTSDAKPFIHPMSHELDFMNLRKAFDGVNNPESFTQKSFEPDYVTLFLYELKRGNLSFKTVKDVKFHFFGVPGWYFELSNFNRPGYNSGWLISGLSAVTEDQKLQLKDFIYGH